jgi:hypothetical protein
MEIVKITIEHEGKTVTIEIPKHLAPTKDACQRGDTWCVNDLLHKFNSEGRWYATGQKC